LTLYQCSAAKNGLRQDYLMPQMDIDTSQIDELFIDSS